MDKATLQALLDLGVDGATQQSKNSIRIPHGEREVVIYNPKAQQWQHRGRVYRGDCAQLVRWLLAN